MEAVDSGLTDTADEALDQALNFLRRRPPALRREIESSAEGQARVSTEWEQGLDAWLDNFPQSQLLRDEAFRRETWYLDRR